MARKLSVGRPPKAEANQLALVPIRFPRELLDRIDAECAARADGPSRSAMIRELVVMGLDAKARRK